MVRVSHIRGKDKRFFSFARFPQLRNLVPYNDAQSYKSIFFISTSALLKKSNITKLEQKVLTTIIKNIFFAAFSVRTLKGLSSEIFSW